MSWSLYKRCWNYIHVSNSYRETEHNTVMASLFRPSQIQEVYTHFSSSYIVTLPFMDHHRDKSPGIHSQKLKLNILWYKTQLGKLFKASWVPSNPDQLNKSHHWYITQLYIYILYTWHFIIYALYILYPPMVSLLPWPVIHWTLNSQSQHYNIHTAHDSAQTKGTPPPPGCSV